MPLKGDISPSALHAALGIHLLEVFELVSVMERGPVPCAGMGSAQNVML